VKLIINYLTLDAGFDFNFTALKATSRPRDFQGSGGGSLTFTELAEGTGLEPASAFAR
jgi:hypothetical protein